MLAATVVEKLPNHFAVAVSDERWSRQREVPTKGIALSQALTSSSLASLRN